MRHTNPRRSGHTATLSLVLPAYNEEDNITEAVAEAREALTPLLADYEILVVDDGSADSTAALVDLAYHDEPRVRLIRHPENRGYGAALRTGFETARCDLVAFTDADRQFHLDDLALLIDAIDGHDVACGYRIDRQDATLRLFYSKVYNWCVRALLGIRVRDVDCALKVFRRETLQGLSLVTEGFLINSEMLTRLAMGGASVVEVGVRHRARVAGTSTVSPLHAVPVLLGLVSLWLFPLDTPSVALQKMKSLREHMG